MPEHYLIFDTETTLDQAQRLLFGCWRYYRSRIVEGRIELIWVTEGLFHPDDLAEWNPEGYEILRQFDGQKLAIDQGEIDATPRLRVQTQTRFLNSVLWRAGYQDRAAVVCFNWPFDISRIARHAGEARNRSGQPTVVDGGFSLMLWPYDLDGSQKQSHYRPSIAIKSIDSKRAFKRFKGPDRIDFVDRIPEGEHQAVEDWKFRGNFLDLRTLAFSLTDRGHTLESACKAFGVPYEKREVKQGVIRAENIEYCREDVEATARLCEATLTEFLRHPITLQAIGAYSPATLGRSYLRAMRVTPPTERQEFDPRVFGWAMSAYYGGRAECRIRKQPVPVCYLDFLSMYPTVCRLVGVWRMLTAKHIDVNQDAADETQAWLDDLKAEDCFDPVLWPRLAGIAQIAPNGDVLPVRARYGETLSWQIGVNPLHSRQAMWFTIADLAAAKILTGKTPTIRRAIQFKPAGGQLSKLTPVDLLGELPVDPAAKDFFQAIVEERKRAEAIGGKSSSRAKGLKVLANATSYGIYAQMTRHQLPNGQRETVRVYGSREKSHTCKIPTPEDPAEYTFPPIAATITGAARLMLALLESRVSAAGGSYAFCDTDSMAIIATTDGGLIPCPGGPHTMPDGQTAVRALSDPQVELIRREFNQLNPYQNAPGTDSILELEDENFTDPKTRDRRRQLYCYAISAKRYVLYNQDQEGKPQLRAYTNLDDDGENPDDTEPAIRKASEHGLGHLLNPIDPDSENRDWIAQTWEHILLTHLGLPATEPDWLDKPAVARTTISSPAISRQFKPLNRDGQDDKPYAEQIKPFNFLNVAFVDKQERPHDERRMVLISPYEKDRNKWLDATWINRYSGLQYHLDPKPSRGRERGGIVHAKTYGDILAEYLAHGEDKSLSPTGQACEPKTAGLLQRRPVLVRSISHIGKEANQLEDVQTQLIAEQDEILNQYDDPDQHYYQTVALPILRQLGPREVARRTGHSLGAVHAALAGKTKKPQRKQRSKYITVADASYQSGGPHSESRVNE